MDGTLCCPGAPLPCLFFLHIKSQLTLLTAQVTIMTKLRLNVSCSASAEQEECDTCSSIAGQQKCGCSALWNWLRSRGKPQSLDSKCGFEPHGNFLLLVPARLIPTKNPLCACAGKEQCNAHRDICKMQSLIRSR